MKKIKPKAKKSNHLTSGSEEKDLRDKYLSTDFGNLLVGLTPLNLGLEFQKPTESISIRLPREVLNQIRIMADERDVPYQSLIKMWLAEKVKRAS